jgi:glycosyltransferase involved in cell wall biosynthesis
MPSHFGFAILEMDLTSEPEPIRTRTVLRCLHVIPSISFVEGGPSLAIGPLCAALNRIEGHQVEIATTVPSGEALTGDGNLIDRGIPVHRFARAFHRKLKYSPDLTRWLRVHAADYDIIHIHTLWSLVSSSAGRAAFRAGVPYIIRPAGMMSPYSWSRGRFKKALYWRWSDRQMIARAAAWHATSAGEAHELQQFQMPPPVYTTPLGIDPQAWRTPPDPLALRQLCGPAAGKLPILLYLSRIHPKKGINDYLLPAFARLKIPAFLAIAGGADGAPGYLAEIEATIARLNLKHRVALLGSITPAKRWGLFDGAAGFVLPSHQENFGLVVAEAMARGCPVVVSDRVQSCDHVLAASAGFVVPLDVDSITVALTQLLAQSARRATFGDLGRRYVAEHLSWDRVGVDVATMYSKILSVSRPNSPRIHHI